MYVPLAILVAGLGVWSYGLWRRGFFGPKTLPVERNAYVLRNALWFISIVIVAWPLQIYRPSIGDTAYVFTAIVVLAVFFCFGMLAKKFLFKLSQARREEI